ncbi:MAG: DUF4149 domain-containing protein [Gallionella sp.]|nr:DUF4149 domain-containing protein [Gallionella sp.]
MKNITRTLAVLTATLWAGSLWSIGYLAVPVLFQAQPDKVLAGMLAGRMFTAVGIIGMLCGTYLIWYCRQIFDKQVWHETTFRIVLLMLGMTLVLQYGIQPAMAELKALSDGADVMQSIYADRFKMLHGLSSVVYLIEGLAGILLVVKISQSTRL